MPASSRDWTKRVLVVANVTASSDELLAMLERLAALQPTAFTLLVPVSAGDATGDRQRLDAALERLRGAGLEVDGVLADSDPVVAVSEAWDPRRHDEIVISTLPMDVSRWHRAGLPKRISDLTGALVTQVVSEPRRPPVPLAPSHRPHEKSVLGPLSVLGWGGHSAHSP